MKHTFSKAISDRAAQMAAYTAVTASAASIAMTTVMASDVFDKAKEVAGNLFTSITSLIIIVGGVCFVIAAIMAIASSSDRAVEGSKRWMIRILVIIAVCACIGPIFSTVAQLGNASINDVTFGGG